METAAKPDGIKIHCALLMLACDIPACRKVAGFAAHSSGHVCNKCEGKFPLVEGKPDFSGINTVASKWPERSKASNLRAALRWRNATTEKEREDLVKANGTRYSELHRLGYFDVVRQSIIDPMHNLLLGTCSRFVKIWKEEGYFTKVNLEKMQVLADSVELPAGFESVDQKIASGLPTLRLTTGKAGACCILPKENMRNWMDFVNACRYILKTGIQQSEVDNAYELFLDFNRVAEGLYGNKCLAMNQHLHGHLKQTIENFSAPHAYWLFSFERCNGYLGSFKNNGKNVEVTFMKKFLEKYNLQRNTIRAYNKAIKSPSSSSPSFQLQKDMETFLHGRIMVGGRSNDRVKRQIAEGFVATKFAESCVNLDINVTGFEPLPLGVVPPKVLTKTVMEESHYKCLLDFYDTAYPGAMALGLLNSDLVAPPFGARWPTTSVYIEKFSSIRLSGKTINSSETRSPSDSCIQSLFVGQNHEKVEAWPGRVLYFFRHSQRVSMVIKMRQDDFEPGQLKCPDCPVTFSNKANLYKHLAKQHRTQVETIKGRCYKGGRRNANLRYYEKKKIEKTLANQDSDSMTATQLRNQRYYRQKMLNEAVTITHAHILDTLFVDFDEELSKLSGDKLKMIRDSRKFHFTNYYEDMKVQYKLITRYTDVPDTYHSRIATITIILDFLHLVFPSNIKKDYDAKRVILMLVGIDVENMPDISFRGIKRKAQR
ncbi:hypothetical protein INT47_005801 [Mucor saturninus]|uniref:C2H2-type domain-containing protein n=1 Tax=Mucor saturninus TaxID=64648 RepID=A0A8H7UYN6_9FUNG|nr:hypothetical protein INT47_005801 [Mucor saturninus]